MTRTVFKCCKHNARAVISPSSTCPRREGDHLIGFERAAVCVKTTRQSCSGTDLWENITGNASSAGEPSAQKKKKKRRKEKSPLHLHQISLVCVLVVTLKMVAPCGRGGAGRDGEVVLADGGWLGAEGLLMEVLTDLEIRKKKICVICDIYK